MHLYQVTNVNPLTEHVSQIFLNPAHSPGLAYQAGQYVEVHHEHHPASPLSIACAPNADATLEFHLFHAHENRRAHDLLRMAQHDKLWHLTGPLGKCTAEGLQKDKPLIFLASGTGLAPIKAVIEALLQTPDYPALHLYWSVRTRQDLYLPSLLSQWQACDNVTVTPIYTKESSSDAALKTIIHQYGDLAPYQVYASGPPPFIHTAVSTLIEHGLERDFFYSDMV